MRPKPVVPVLVALLATLSAVSGCGERPASVNPAGGGRSGVLVLGAPSVERLPVLRRAEPLLADEVATALVGSDGAELDLPRAGLRVFIPPHAVAGPTQVTVRAPAGDLVGYEMEPRGLHLGRTAVVMQDLKETRAGVALPGTLVGASHRGDLAPVVDVLGALPVRILPPADDAAASFRIRQLGRYVIGAG